MKRCRVGVRRGVPSTGSRFASEIGKVANARQCTPQKGCAARFRGMDIGGHQDGEGAWRELRRSAATWYAGDPSARRRPRGFVHLHETRYQLPPSNLCATLKQGRRRIDYIATDRDIKVGGSRSSVWLGQPSERRKYLAGGSSVGNTAHRSRLQCTAYSQNFRRCEFILTWSHTVDDTY